MIHKSAYEIAKELEQMKDNPIDYIEFQIYDHGTDAEPFSLAVPYLYDEENEQDEELGVNTVARQTSELLMDLEDDYELKEVEYMVEEFNDEPVFIIRVIAVLSDEPNITDEVFDAFQELSTRVTKEEDKQ